VRGSARRAARSRGRRSRALADRVRRVVGASLLDGPLGDPLDQHLAVGDLKLEDDVEVAAEPGEELVERLGLGGVPREAVEDEARDRVAAVEPRLDQLDDRRVVDELAAVVDLLDAPARAPCRAP
jgi:hypothetical protein